MPGRQPRARQDAEDGGRILLGSPEDLTSQFSISYGMVLNLLKYRTADEARDIIKLSFGNFQSATDRDNLRR